MVFIAPKKIMHITIFRRIISKMGRTKKEQLDYSQNYNRYNAIDMKLLTIMLLFVISYTHAQDTLNRYQHAHAPLYPFKVAQGETTQLIAKFLIQLPDGRNSYMDMAGTWHLTDTIATLNVLMKDEMSISKGFNAGIDRLEAIIARQKRTITKLEKLIKKRKK